MSRPAVERKTSPSDTFTSRTFKKLRRGFFGGFGADGEPGVVDETSLAFFAEPRARMA